MENSVFKSLKPGDRVMYNGETSGIIKQTEGTRPTEGTHTEVYDILIEKDAGGFLWVNHTEAGRLTFCAAPVFVWFVEAGHARYHGPMPEDEFTEWDNLHSDYEEIFDELTEDDARRAMRAFETGQ